MSAAAEAWTGLAGSSKPGQFDPYPNQTKEKRVNTANNKHFKFSLTSGKLLFASMFVLVAMKDLLEIPPWKFREDRVETVTAELNKKLANKVEC